MNDIIELKITLEGTKPPIWRQFLVDKHIDFETLHETIQIVMGWQDYHMYQFIVGKKIILAEELEYEEFNEEDQSAYASDVTLKELITKKGQKFMYEYDFGDGWLHEIEVIDFQDIKEAANIPLCIAGSMACPPEDCGGLPGYYNMINTLKTKDEEYDDLIEWLGTDYDPEKFSIDDVNDDLNADDYWDDDWDDDDDDWDDDDEDWDDDDEDWDDDDEENGIEEEDNPKKNGKKDEDNWTLF
jgi:hypothetical protein